MDARGSLATLSLIVCALGGCTADAGVDGPPPPAPEKDEPLDVSVDSLDVVHGALRVIATMTDGAADVSVRLGGACEHRDVGGGVSTRSTLVWAFGDRDVAAAIGCGLVVRARVREGARYVNRIAEVAVTVDVAPQESDDAADGPQLQTVSLSDTGVTLSFGALPRGARLSTAGSVLEALSRAPGEEPADDDTGRFVVAPIDFARSVLSRQPLSLERSTFAPSLSVGGTSMDDDSPEQPEEIAPDDPGESEGEG